MFNNVYLESRPTIHQTLIKKKTKFRRESQPSPQRKGYFSHTTHPLLKHKEDAVIVVYCQMIGEISAYIALKTSQCWTVKGTRQSYKKRDSSLLHTWMLIWRAQWDGGYIHLSPLEEPTVASLLISLRITWNSCSLIAFHCWDTPVKKSFAE